MTRYPALDRHLPSVARPLGWWLDGLARYAGPMRPPPPRAPRLTPDADGAPQAGDLRGRRAAVLAVPVADWLTLDTALPQTDRAALRDIAALEVQDRTPFAPDQVWIGWTPGALHVVRKDVVAPALEQVAARGGRLRWLVPAADPGARVIDLAPPPERPFRAVLWLGGGAVLAGALACGVLWAGLGALQAERDAVAVSLAQNGVAAAEAATLAGQIAALETTRAAGRPAALQPHRPPVHVLLETLTRILPDNSYLTGLDIGSAEVRLRGIGAAPETLVRLIAQDPAFDGASFDGAVTRDPAGTRFAITARIAGVPQ